LNFGAVTFYALQYALEHSEPLMLEYNNKVDHITMRRQTRKEQGIYTT
jgi:hypothetical protein